MDLPKNIVQIGEPGGNCRIYVEDYVTSYIKQLNRHAGDKAMAVGLYGVRKEEAGITYLFFYGAVRLNFLQRESRHLSQAVLQEAEQQRRKFFPQYEFLGYRLLNGELVEGFHVCQQNICRYIAGYAQFYEKNDSMLAFMLDDRKEEAKPEEFNQEKYDEVKKRQEERRQQAEEQSGQAVPFRKNKKVQNAGGRIRRMQYTAAAVFVVLCAAGFAVMNNEKARETLNMAASQMLEDASTQQLPDVMEAANPSAQVGTIVTEDKLTAAILQENTAAAGSQTNAPDRSALPEITPDPVPETTTSPEPIPQETVDPEPAPTDDPESAPEDSAALAPSPEAETAAEPASYVIRRGDTLIGICTARYGSDEKVAEICNFNGIADPNDIKVGQKILLP